MGTAVKVFISYSHDSAEHSQLVLGLSERLRFDGVDANIDQYVQGTPAETWPRWMVDEIGDADFVLVICTETYYRRFRGHEEPKRGMGVDWEGAVISNEIYDTRSRSTKFVPIQFEANSEQYVPEPLRGQTRYLLSSEEEYGTLYDFLLGQAGIVPQELGDPNVKPRRQGNILRFGVPANTARSCTVGPSRLPRINTPKLVGRSRELEALHRTWGAALQGSTPRPRIVSIVAWGGVGKTAVVAHWMDELAASGWQRTERVFEWSFYSQGVQGHSGASADKFFNEALTFFGDIQLATSNAAGVVKGERLAELVSGGQNILVLDGIEPLQHPPGQRAGMFRDPGIGALLRSIARRGGSGLCVVTTRESATDLTRFIGTTVREIELEQLSDAAGSDLLESLGVRGSRAEREKLSHDVRGHALTLELLGSYLARAHDGDIRRRDQVTLEAADQSEQGGHAFRVMAAYEQWLESGGKHGKRQLALLRLMGFFDRPAEPQCLDALCQLSAVRGLPNPLGNLSEASWNTVVRDLEEAGLVRTSPHRTRIVRGYTQDQAARPRTARGEPALFVPPASRRAHGSREVDVHPLLREYFARQLRTRSPDGFRMGHKILYDHLIHSVPFWPDGLDGLQPLYQAVRHGCLAGLPDTTCQRVFRGRIQRGEECYSSRQLGAFGADISAFACFFESQWSRPIGSFSEDDQAWLFVGVGYCLRADGRLTEALAPMKSGIALYVKQGNQELAALSYSNLAELELALGDLVATLESAEKSVEFADASGDRFQRCARRARFADALHHTGQSERARAIFQLAETLQIGLAPKIPQLISLRGFQYCDLLLAEAERDAWCLAQNADSAEQCRAVARRANYALDLGRRAGMSLVNVALDHLTLARAEFYLSIVEPGERSARDSARDVLDLAIEELRASGYVDRLPLGLLTRAWLRGHCGDIDAASAELDEVWEIAERGPMRLFLADVHLYRARLLGDRKELAKARRMITELGYGRRSRELEDAEREMMSPPHRQTGVQQ